MNAQMQKLEAILTEELRLYGELARACSEVNDKVRCCDLDGLAEVTREQNELIMAAAEIEKGRRAVLTQLFESEDESVQVAESDAESALECIAEPYASKLVDHAASIRAIVDELRVLSRRNRSLLSYSSRLVDRAVRFACGMPESDRTYERPGSHVDRPRVNQALLNAQA